MLAAHENGAYVLRLEGDVRLTLCTSIEDYVERMLDDPDFCSVCVDLCDARGIDSTTLGQLAKLALSVQERFGFRPAVYSCDAGINRLLSSMGLDRLFEIFESPSNAVECIEHIPMIPGSESVVRERVLEAHAVLMNVSEDNRERFSELVQTLSHCDQA